MGDFEKHLDGWILLRIQNNMISFLTISQEIVQCFIEGLLNGYFQFKMTIFLKTFIYNVQSHPYLRYLNF